MIPEDLDHETKLNLAYFYLQAAKTVEERKRAFKALWQARKGAETSTLKET